MGRLAQKLHSTGASRSSGAIPTWFRLRPYRFDGCRIWSRRASRANRHGCFGVKEPGYWPGPIAGVVSGARRHHPALHPTPRRPCLLEPAAGRSDPTGPATRRAHRDAADRTRSAARLGRAAQTAHKLNMRTAQPCSGRSLQPGLSVVADDPAFPKVGLPQCLSENKGRTAPARARHVPSLVPVHAQSAAKPRASPPTAMEFTIDAQVASRIGTLGARRWSKARWIGSDFGLLNGGRPAAVRRSYDRADGAGSARRDQFPSMKSSIISRTASTICTPFAVRNADSPVVCPLR